jgi:cytochrome c556
MVLLPPVGSAEDKDVIDYRQHIMNTLNEQAGALGEILSGAIPNDHAVDHIRAIALTAATALKAFEPKVAGGQSRPVVWTDWTDFSKRMNEFAQKTAEVTKMADEKGKDAALANIAGALTCKSCHDVYREDKKK